MDPAEESNISRRLSHALHRIRDGMAASEHVYFDQLDMMTQLGAMPGTGGGGALPN